MGYIQGNSHFKIWVKLLARSDMKEICKKFIKDDILQIPFKLIGADQVLPVNFQIKARMTTHLLKFTTEIPDPMESGKLL